MVLLLLLAILKHLTRNPTAKDTICLSHIALKSQSDKEAEVLSILTCFHSTNRCYATYLKKQAIISHAQLQTFLPTVMTDLVWEYYGSKQTLPDCV